MTFNGIPHILSPFSSPWVAWMMLGLLACATLAEVFQPAVIRQGFVNLFTKAERSYSDAPLKYVGQVFLLVFRIGIVSMAISLFTYRGGTFDILRYLTIAGALAGVEVVKYLAALLLNYTFQLSNQFSTLFTHYTYVSTTTGCILYPLLLLIIYIDVPVFTTISLCVIAGAFVLLLLVKWLRLFLTDIVSFFYILLYVLTVEVIPLLAIIVLFS